MLDRRERKRHKCWNECRKARFCCDVRRISRSQGIGCCRCWRTAVRPACASSITIALVLSATACRPSAAMLCLLYAFSFSLLFRFHFHCDDRCNLTLCIDVRCAIRVECKGVGGGNASNGCAVSTARYDRHVYDAIATGRQTHRSRQFRHCLSSLLRRVCAEFFFAIRCSLLFVIRQKCVIHR
jgi:hypothetical protein